MKKKVIALLGSAVLLTGMAYASEKGHWGYSGHQGPEYWGSLSEEFAICASGKNQSPINITGTVEAELAPIQFNYMPTSLKVVNNGHTIKADYAPGSTITLDGHTFKLLQFHFHAPSENAIEGKLFPMEAHLVHADEDGNLAVIGVMYSEGKANSTIGSVWDKMPAAVGQTVTADNVSVNVMDILPANKDYYRFNGSLTTPPCSEGVQWMEMQDVVEVSAEQVKKFHSTMHGDTNRPVQPVHARSVLK